MGGKIAVNRRRKPETSKIEPNTKASDCKKAKPEKKVATDSYWSNGEGKGIPALRKKDGELC